MKRLLSAAVTVLLCSFAVATTALGDDPARPTGPAPAGAAATAPESTCTIPSDLLAPMPPLTHAAQAIAHGTLDILAVGSATMLGPRGGTEGSLPYRVADTLRKAFPQAAFRLSVHGGRGLTAAEMQAAVKGELAQHAYQLVIWQTGTVEAVRNLPADDLLRTVSDGAAATHEANADMILIDPQYSRFLRANVDLDPYLQALVQAAGLPDVALFHRYDLMKYLVDSSQIDLERAAKPDRHAVAEALNNCIASVFAGAVVQGVAAAKR